MNINSNNNCLKQGNSETKATSLVSQLPSGAFLPLLRAALPQKFPPGLSVMSWAVKCPLSGPGTSPTMVKVRVTLTMGRNSCGLTKEGMTAAVISHPLTGLEHSLPELYPEGNRLHSHCIFENSSSYQPRLRVEIYG